MAYALGLLALGLLISVLLLTLHIAKQTDQLRTARNTMVDVEMELRAVTSYALMPRANVQALRADIDELRGMLTRAVRTIEKPARIKRMRR